MSKWLRSGQGKAQFDQRKNKAVLLLRRQR
jgi:hypothetical protein